MLSRSDLRQITIRNNVVCIGLVNGFCISMDSLGRQMQPEKSLADDLFSAVLAGRHGGGFESGDAGAGHCVLMDP